ncbi:EcoKI restriction-modification system protein HsdS [mine drainage metagenome]|uniref:EcoKI restriction-modification system protein HsdS n=1 Tax=mine drainage metagenome TaxID=410659 RepID=A0A1J5RPF6_9ZZZZ
MEVRPGYKQTEVGVIPETWSVDRLEKYWSVTDCKHVTAEFVDNGYPLASIKEVQSKFVELANAKQTTQGFYNLLIEGGRKPRVGDLIISRNATVGEVAQVADWHPLFAMGQDVCLLRKRDQEDSTNFLQAVFRSPVIANQLSDFMVGSTFKRINVQQIKSFTVPMPPTAEQRAIAQSLSDVDALLEGLDRLIAKKRDLKQAAMQQLLTGQTRLPGFSGEWEVKRLGDLFKFSGGYSASRDQLSTEGHCYLHYGDIHGSSKTTIDTKADHQDIPKLDIPLKRVSPDSLLADGDVVFVDASEDDEGTSKHVVVVNKGGLPFISGLHTIVAKARTAELAHEYLRYCFQTTAIRQQFMFYAVGTKVSGISKTNIVKLTLPISSVPEQTAIAAVLSDMDAELSALVARRDKTRDLKQAMMQELLTGRIRLV